MEWFGTIPKGWEQRKIKYLFTERVQKGYPDEPLLVASQNMGVVPKNIYGNRTVEATKDLHLLKLVEVGDFVISLRSFQGGIEYAWYRGIISPAYTILIPCVEMKSGYFRYFAKSQPFIELLQNMVTGIREGQNINYEKLKNEYIPLPPLSEQEQIVRYLDWKVSGINRLVNAKKKQIELLKEQKRAVVNEAVTRGGEGWTETRIINLIETIKAGAWGENENVLEVNLPCIRVTDFDFFRFRVREAEYTIRSYPQNTVDKLLLKKGDILIEKSGGGDKQTVGRAVLFDKDIKMLYANFIEAARPKDVVCSLFLVYLLASMYYREYQRFHFNQTTGIQNLDVKGYLRKSTLIPQLPEQQAIVAYLDEKCSKIDRLTDKITAEISLLGEYKTRLISDVVTGKLDVSDVALPEFDAVAAEADDTTYEIESEQEDE